MKKTAATLFACLFFCMALLCSCTQAQPDPKAIVGQWEYRQQMWCDFKEDGTCAIGGTTGNYSVSDDMTLSLTPKGGDKQTFEWAGSKEKVTTSNWFIADGVLYMNGGQYLWMEPDTGESASSVSSGGNVSSSSSAAATEAATKA